MPLIQKWSIRGRIEVLSRG